MLFNIIIVAFYWQILFLGSINSSKPKKIIPDLNFPPPIEQGDVHHTQSSREIFKNKNHDKPEISVEIEPLPPNHHETGLFQTQKSMTVKGKVYYSDEKRNEWKERKRAQRELLKDDERKAIYRKEYYQKKEKAEKKVRLSVKIKV